MYPNVKAEFARRGWTLEVVGEKLNMAVSTLSTKMRSTGFSLKEAKQIKEILETDLSIEELFEEASE